MNVTVDFSKAPFYSKIPRLSKKAVGNFKDVVSVAQRGMCMSLLVFVAGICFFGLFGETLLALIGSNTKFISVEFWSILGLAYFIERYAAMHLNIYTLSNHIIGKFKTIIEDGASIGSNTALVAPVKIGAGAIIGAGSTITADVPNDAIATTRSALDVRHDAAVRYRKIRNEQS